jgi:hypothetical protein
LIDEIVYSRVKFFFSAFFLLGLQALVHAQQITYETVYVDYDSAIEFKNLKLIPIRPKQGMGGSHSGIISLSKALEKGMATVSERGTASTENVHYLRIQNHSDKTIYVASGEIITGWLPGTPCWFLMAGISIFLSCVWKRAGGVTKRKNSAIALLQILR